MAYITEWAWCRSVVSQEHNPVALQLGIQRIRSRQDKIMRFGHDVFSEYSDESVHIRMNFVI